MTDIKKPAAETAKPEPAKPVRASEAQEGRGDRRTAGSRADPLRRLAVQRQGDGFLSHADPGQVFHPDFKAAPWWWEAWTPNNALSQDPPAKTDVVIVGAGYGGLSTALELRRNGVGAVVLERGDFGVGASTRNGGMISGGINMGKGLGGKSQVAEEFEAKKAAFLGAGADSLSVLEDIIAREKIECGVIKKGRFVGAWTPKHYAEQAAKVEMFNKYANVGAEMVPRERQREFIASDYYFGGMYARALGPSASGALLQGPAGSGTPRRRHPVRQCRGRAHREDGDRLARADAPRGRSRPRRS